MLGQLYDGSCLNIFTIINPNWELGKLKKASRSEAFVSVLVYVEMKGANYYRMRGRHISVFLLTVTFTTIFLWTWEKSPFLRTRSAIEQFSFRSSDFLVNAPKDSSSAVSLEPKKHIEEKISDAASSDETEKPEENFNVPPMNITTSYPHEREDSDEDGASSSEMKVCNYAKGRWVPDSRRLLYSGLGCKQWLSEMWACRMTQRTDFSFEGYHWQPENCKMEEFERTSFLRRMQDKTIAFIGDSLGRQQFQSLMCMATGGEWSLDIENVGWKYGLVKPRGATRPDGWAYWFSNTNTTILYYWSASLADLEPLKNTTDVAMNLDRAPVFMRRYLHQFDVLVLNTGHHWNRGKINANHWVMHVNGSPIKDRKLMEIGNAKNFTVHSVARWLDSQLPSYPRLKAFFRTISPRHFRNGDWNAGGNCDNTIPLTGGSEVSQDESSDPVIAAAVKGTRVKLLDITALSELRDEGHVSRYSVKATQGVNDCLHWCLPGIPDTWNELLAAQV